MTESWKHTFRNMFFPVFCRECGCPLLTEENGYFCPDCWTLPERIERPFCSRCGLPHKERVGFGTVQNFPCAQCESAPPTSYRRIFAAAVYEEAIAEAVKLLKFYERRRIADSLAEIMTEFALREMDCGAYDALVPVPLHSVRLRARGFNQAELLAQKLLPTFPRAILGLDLQRIRPTRTQSSIKDQQEGLENVIGAFAVDRMITYEGQTVLLIDDVVTTGGTASECASALHRAGASHVDVLAAAKPVNDPDAPGRNLRRERPHRMRTRIFAR